MSGQAFNDLKGRPLAANVDLFAKPNAGIGEILHAYSDLRVGEKMVTASKRTKGELTFG